MCIDTPNYNRELFCLKRKKSPNIDKTELCEDMDRIPLMKNILLRASKRVESSLKELIPFSFCTQREM